MNAICYVSRRQALVRAIDATSRVVSAMGLHACMPDGFQQRIAANRDELIGMVAAHQQRRRPALRMIQGGLSDLPKEQ